MKFNKLYIYYILAVILFIAAVVIDRSTRKADLKEITEKGVLRVSTNYNELNYFMDGDSVRGFQYELVNVICDSLGLKPEWVLENKLEKSIALLEKGEVDLIAQNIPVTTELREQLAFSTPIINTQQVLVQRKMEFNNGVAPIRDQLFLAKKTIHLPQNSPSLLRLRNLESEIADTINIIEHQNLTTEQLMIMVAKNDIDYAVCDLQTARINTMLLPEIDIKTAISFTQMYSWAMRPSSFHLKTKVDSFLYRFKKTRAYRDIYRKYYK